MADPATARRVIFSSYVIPQESVSSEEGIEKWRIEEGVGKTFGGKGTATLTNAQWGDGWTSFAHQDATWDDQSDVWELQGKVWNGILTLAPATPVDLTDDSSTLAFLYIKNTKAGT